MQWNAFFFSFAYSMHPSNAHLFCMDIFSTFFSSLYSFCYASKHRLVCMTLGYIFINPHTPFLFLKIKDTTRLFLQEKKIGSFYDSTSNCKIQILVSIYKIADIRLVFFKLMCSLLYAVFRSFFIFACCNCYF